MSYAARTTGYEPSPLSVQASFAARDLARRCSVSDFGADASGNSSSTAAIGNALAACGEIIFEHGRFISGTIELPHDTVVRIRSSAVVLGASSESGEYITASRNRWSSYQDYGHGGWSDALFYGNGVRNVTITGEGVVDGNGGLANSKPPKGGGCKMFSFVDSARVAVTGSLTLRDGGWFTMLFTNCDGIHLAGFDLRAVRDGINLMQSRNVHVEDIRIHGGRDDALKFGSDYSRGKSVASYNVLVRNSILGSSHGYAAIAFGTETVGDFYNFTFENLKLMGAMSGIALTSYDGAHIHDLTFRDIQMSDLASPFFFAIYARLRRPMKLVESRDARVGSIRNINLHRIFAENLRAKETKGLYATPVAMLDGMPRLVLEHIFQEHPIGPGISFRDVELRFPGLGEVAATCLPGITLAKKYPMGDVPAYAAYFRRVRGVHLKNVTASLAPAVADGRPAIVIEDSNAVQLRDVAVHRSNGSGYDVEVRRSHSIDSSVGLEVVQDPCNPLLLGSKLGDPLLLGSKLARTISLCGYTWCLRFQVTALCGLLFLGCCCWCYLRVRPRRPVTASKRISLSASGYCPREGEPRERERLSA